MEFVEFDVNSLKPAKYNPRKQLKPEDPEYQKIKRSLQELGYCDPIIVNKDLTVIGGHQRLTVLKDIGYKSVQCIQVDLPKNKEKALNIALNKITGEWDPDKLQDLMLDLNSTGFDLELTGFDLEEIEGMINPQEDQKTENARMNTIHQYNLDLYDETETSGFYQMPIIRNDHILPDELIGMNYMLTSHDPKASLHFFVDDYQFERLWNSPAEYIDHLKEYKCVLSPDFSLYLDMPMAMKIWNVYRSRLLGHFWQSCGIKVIPTISWAEADTFAFAFDGIPEGSNVAISTIGVKREDDSMKIWTDGMDAMISKIHPASIIEYGGDIGYDYGETKVIRYLNKVTENMKQK